MPLDDQALFYIANNRNVRRSKTVAQLLASTLQSDN